MLNNIIVPRAGGNVTTNNKNRQNRWDYNLYPFPQQIVTGAHDIVADPQLPDINTMITSGKFYLNKNSRALHACTSDVPQGTDLSGKPKPKGRGRDIGAFE